ncbi:hypothetical protein [Massilia sp. CCM 8734]|uniref:hypothetical protein n=1 Tax=Massilia sp. CCM 8734 TaxID=2609283 RepID=UPI001420D864|nr:hypothetical protein [Massilia sp. CCM 8734]NHZ99914.1 hypothetical protein [Massilia sp. CCM 8734]
MPDPSSPVQAEPSPPRPLFRLQALEHAGARQYGQVILARSPGQRELTILFAGLALSIVAFFLCFSTTRKAQSQGLLLPTGGVIRVIPGRVGVVMERRVREGQQVAAGDVLVVVSGKRTIAAAGSTEQTVAALLNQRRDSYRAELDKVIVQAAQRSGGWTISAPNWRAWWSRSRCRKTGWPWRAKRSAGTRAWPGPTIYRPTS